MKDDECVSDMDTCRHIRYTKKVFIKKIALSLHSFYFLSFMVIVMVINIINEHIVINISAKELN